MKEIDEKIQMEAMIAEQSKNTKIEALKVRPKQ